MSSIQHAIAGSVAGMAAMAATYPLASWTTARQTSKKPRGLYAGLESALVGISAVNFLYYYVYNLLKMMLKRRGYVYLNVSQSLFTSIVAGLVSRIISNPIWVANTKMTLSTTKTVDDDNDNNNKSTLSTILSIYKTGGLTELMSGLAPALVLVSSPVIQFTLYEQVKNYIVKKHSKPLDPNNALIWGGLTKLIAILLTYPYYTLRSRMHMDNKKLTLLQMTKKMYNEEGLKSFYGGLDAKLVQSVINAALVFYIKEQIMKVLSLRGNSRRIGGSGQIKIQ